MGEYYDKRPQVFKIDDSGERYCIGVEVGQYMKCYRGSLYKKFPRLFKRFATIEERGKILQTALPSPFLNSNLMLVKASEVNELLSGKEEKYRAGGRNGLISSFGSSVSGTSSSESTGSEEIPSVFSTAVKMESADDKNNVCSRDPDGGMSVDEEASSASPPEITIGSLDDVAASSSGSLDSQIRVRKEDLKSWLALRPKSPQPLNNVGYALFSIIVFRRLQQDNPDAPLGELNKIATVQWKKLSVEERELYETRAESIANEPEQQVSVIPKQSSLLEVPSVFSTAVKSESADSKDEISIGHRGSEVPLEQVPLKNGTSFTNLPAISAENRDDLDADASTFLDSVMSTKRRPVASVTLPPLKRPKSGYIIFAADVRKRIAQENPEASFGEISKMVGEKWLSLTVEERKEYDNRAARLAFETTKQGSLELQQSDLPPGHVRAFLCRWNKCDLLFDGSVGLYQHLKEVHTYQLAGVNGYACLWATCVKYRSRNKRFNTLPRLLRHIRDKHLFSSMKSVHPNELRSQGGYGNGRSQQEVSSGVADSGMMYIPALEATPTFNQQQYAVSTTPFSRYMGLPTTSNQFVASGLGDGPLTFYLASGEPNCFDAGIEGQAYGANEEQE